MKIDHDDSAARHSLHLAENLNYLLLDKMMRKQRTDHVIKIPARERQRQCIASHRSDLRKLMRLFENRRGGPFIQFKSDCANGATRLSGPSRGDAQQFSGSGADIKH